MRHFSFSFFSQRPFFILVDARNNSGNSPTTIAAIVGGTIASFFAVLAICVMGYYYRTRMMKGGTVYICHGEDNFQRDVIPVEVEEVSSPQPTPTARQS